MVFDGHSDIFTDVTIRTLAGEQGVLKRLHQERLQKGDFEGGIFVIWADPPYSKEPYKRNLQTLKAIKQEMAVSTDFVIVKTYAELLTAKADGKYYIFIGIEGLSGIGDNIELINDYYEFGARHAMLTWNEENALATGAHGDPDRGLTTAGLRAVHLLESKRMLVDVSHLNEKSFWAVADAATRPLVASHSNARALCDVPRNLSDEQLLKIRDLDGLIGINAFHEFVDLECANQNMEHLANHIQYIAEKIGPEHVGFGFDFFEYLAVDNSNEAGSGILRSNSSVSGLPDCSAVPNFIKLLKTKGFSDSELAGFKFKNWHQIIQNVIG